MRLFYRKQDRNTDNIKTRDEYPKKIPRIRIRPLFETKKKYIYSLGK